MWESTTQMARAIWEGACQQGVAAKLFDLRAIWSDVTRRIATLRDNPECAESEFRLKLQPDNPGIVP